MRVPESAPQDFKVRLASLTPTERFDQQKVDRIYRVRSGDTLSTIASAHGTSIATLMRLNDLKSPHQVRRGQVLQLPGSEPRPVTVAAAAAPAPTAATIPAAPTGQAPAVAAEVYVVKRGDSLSNIARQAGLSEQQLMTLNGLKDRNFIYEGQKLQVASAGEKLPTGVVTVTEVTPQAVIADVEAQPEELPQSEREIALTQAAQPVSASQAEEISPNLVTGAETTAMTADPSDYTVAEDGTIEVQAAETLGHYADWLGVRASRLRELNSMRFGTPVVIGQRLKIDTARVPADQFEQRRRSYHQKLQEDFFTANRIVGTEVHVVRRGESLWTIAQKYPNVPIWLLRQYNPDVSFDDVRPRTQLVMPLIQATGAGGTS
jgi:membrane-bound lytic murein transglycosylase D